MARSGVIIEIVTEQVEEAYDGLDQSWRDSASLIWCEYAWLLSRDAMSHSCYLLMSDWTRVYWRALPRVA